MNSQLNRFRMFLSVKLFALSLMLCIFLASGEKSLYAQSNIRIFHTQEHEAKSDTYLGRDLWFCIPQNYIGSAAKYFNVYVNSPRNTTVNFQVGNNKIIKKPVTAGKVTVFKTPTPKSPGGDLSLSTEISTSGVIENKSIHVWSDDADIAVYLLSRRDYSSDGMYVIPSTGWGKEYIVGAYESIFDPSGAADWPSEFAIVSNQDNTSITITPNWDLRKDGFPSVIEHPKNQPFSVSLNKGECIQYQTILPVDLNTCDVTGTIITSSNPIGVMGGSVCPYIPFPNGYCDYVLDMLQPVRTWSNTYYTSPFAGRKYGGDVYLVVATKPQAIYRNNVQIALLNKYGDHLFIYDETAPSPAAIWTSDAPFELVQYVPSAKFGAPSAGTTRNQGDPAMVVINPADQFGKKVYFQTPTIDLASGQTNFTNYVNLLLPSNNEATTTYDGTLLNAAILPPNIQKRERFPVPGTSWEAMRLTYNTGLGEGTHVVISDTGVGVYIYGYGTDDSYAWSGALGTRTVNDPDTIPPVAIADGPCFCAHVRISDTGPGQSKLSSFVVDSAFNMAFYPDPAFVPGAGTDNSFYDMCVIDSTLPAYLSVSVYDIAGNRTTVISKYNPQFVKFSPNPLNFGTVNVGNTSFKYDTICNTGQNPFHFKAANLNFTNGTKTDNVGFTIDSASDIDIPVGGCILIKIKFSSLIPPTVKDTMTIADECVKIKASVVGNGGAPDFDIADYKWDCTPLRANRPSQNYVITNPSGIDIQVDTVWVDDIINFGYDQVNPPTNKTPFIVPNSNTLSGQYQIVVTFNPQSLGLLSTKIHVKAKGEIKTATISGYGCMPDFISTIGTGTVSCGFPFNFKVPIQNKGTYRDTILNVKGFNVTKGFSFVKVEDPLGNPVILPYSLDSGKVIYATVDYTPPSHGSGCFTDTIIVKSNILGDRAVTTTVRICVLDPQASATNVDFGPFPFGGAKVQNFFQVCDTGQDPLTISAIQPLSAAGSTSFTLTNVYKVGGVVKTLPVVLAPKECLDAYVEFDPAKSNISVQNDSFAIINNGCDGNKQSNVLAQVQIGSPQIQGFSDPPLFSCDVHTDSVSYTNPNSIAGKITAVTVSGADRAFFTNTSSLPIIVPPNTTIKIPVQFIPAPQNAVRTYTAMVRVTYDNGAGFIKDDSAVVTAISQGIDLTVTSRFTTPVSKTGVAIDLPIQFTVDKHGLNTPLANVDIRRIGLAYVYNMNILDILKNNIPAAVKLTNPAWTVDPSSNINSATNTLQLNLIGTAALTDADLAAPFGTITFMPSVPKSGVSTDVKLVTTNFINSSSQPIPNCTSLKKLDSTFSLLYSCGDFSLQKLLNGEHIMSANPVTPNPAGGASGRVLNFRYAARSEGVISLVIYDELGKEAARVIDYQRMPAGTFEVRYNTETLAEGTYIYRFTLNNTYVTSGRVVIQK